MYPDIPTFLKLEQFLLKYNCCPLSNTLNLPVYNISHFRELGRESNHYQKIVNLVNRNFQFKNIHELHDFHLNSNCFFMAYDGDINKKYYTLNESILKLNQFLKFQCNDSEENTYDFLLNLFKTLNRNNDKKNTIFLLGESCTFKSWFVEMISSYCMSFGTIQNFTKFNQFPMSDCADKRLLIWDEPQFNVDHIEQMKLFTAGNPCPISVKYQNNVIMNKTPIIIMGNRYIFPKNEEFNSRINTFIFQKVPFWNEIKKNIWPPALYEIFKLYGIIN